MLSFSFSLRGFGGGFKVARFLVALAVGFLLLSSPSGLRAQALSGINGTVTDPSDVPVSDAKVIVTNTDTGVSRATETSSAGTYYITDLIPGPYTVKIEKPGFKTSVQNNVIVQAGTQSTANASLQLGNVAETIEVTASEISLQTEEPRPSTTIQEALVNDLPVLINGSGRQIDSFLFLAPGVTGDSFSHRINGGLDFQNEVIFNGVPVAFAETQGFQSYITPPFEFLKEFTVVQGSFSAQYGLAQGVAQYQFKSGTNKLHGDVFEISRNSYFDAPGADANRDPVTNDKITKVDRETNYGFSVGGPVFLPRLYEGKDKTFWFMSLEKFRQANSQKAVNVPTPAMVSGDFSGLVDPVFGTPVTIYVPTAWASDPSLMPAGCVPGAAPGQPFPGNKIPSSCISKVSQSLLGFIPKPNANGSGSNGLNSNYYPTFVPVKTQTNWAISGDHNLTSKQALHAVYWRNHQGTEGGFIQNPLNNSTTNYLLGTALLVTYSNAVTPRLVMTAGVSWLGETNNFYQQNPIGSFAGAAPSPFGGVYLPGINFGGGSWRPQSWGTGGWQYSINQKHGLGIANNWLYTRGRHTMNFGVDIRRTFQTDNECQRCAGSLNFDATTTANSSNGGGNSFASFLLGDANSAGRQFAGSSHLSNSYIAPYFQDNIKITPKLTVNAGLRWDLAFPFSNDNSSNQLAFFNPGVPNPGAINPATGQPRLGAMSIFGSGCTGCIGWDHMDMQWKHFSPRLGFAYQINNKTVLLAGLSFSFLDTGAFEYGDNKVAANYGNLLHGTVDYSPGANRVPGYGQWDSTGTGPLPSPTKAAAFTPQFYDTHFPNEMHKHVNQGYTELLTLGMQRELPGKLFASFSLVHTHDLHLPSSLTQRNALDYGFVQSQCAAGLANYGDCILGQAWTSSAAQNFLQAQGFAQATVAPGGCPAGSVKPGFSGTYYVPYANFGCDYTLGQPVLRAFLPFPQFRGISNNFDTNGADKYNALQASLQKRTGSGVTFLVAYTLSRTLSNTDSGFSTFNFKGLNPKNPNAEWSVGNDDRTHIVNIAEVYELPFGPGKKFLNRGGLLMKNLIGGWAFSGIYTYSSGTPVQLQACGSQDNQTSTFNCSPLAYTNGSNRPNVDPTAPFNVNWNNYYKGLPVFNTQKFSYPGAWTLGNGAPLYTRLRYPFNGNETISLKKKFFFGERVTAELAMQYDNVLNRMQVCGSPDSEVTDNSFGIDSPAATCQGNKPRRGQAFFRVNF
jgi:hypothetical protein